MVHVRILGAGVAGLTAAYECARRGAAVEVFERDARAGLGCSFYAGGMIAPWCERESAEPIVCEMGEAALDFWTREIPVATTAGSLVVAPPRDAAELRRFGRRTSGFETIDGDRLASLEPDLAGRFASALYFPAEAHLEPRRAVAALVEALSTMPNVTLRFGADAGPAGAGWTIDARGLAARDRLPDLRGVKGEMVVLRTADVALARPVRMVHPRHPVYIVPRPGHTFMIGATMVENEERGRVTARAMLELLGAAYVLHPAFGEAEIVETGCDLRPAFPDNLPRVVRQDRTILVNGLFRHGFLLAPALARQAADMIFEAYGRADTRDDAGHDARELAQDHPRKRRAASG